MNRLEVYIRCSKCESYLFFKEKKSIDEGSPVTISVDPCTKCQEYEAKCTWKEAVEYATGKSQS